MADAESRNLPADKRSEIAEELADVLLYLIQLADKLDVDLLEAGRSKLAKNAIKYPVALARGSSRKYTEL